MIAGDRDDGHLELRELRSSPLELLSPTAVRQIAGDDAELRGEPAPQLVQRGVGLRELVSAEMKVRDVEEP